MLSICASKARSKLFKPTKSFPFSDFWSRASSDQSWEILGSEIRSPWTGLLCILVCNIIPSFLGSYPAADVIATRRTPSWDDSLSPQEGLYLRFQRCSACSGGNIRQNFHPECASIPQHISPPTQIPYRSWLVKPSQRTAANQS